ncbi:MAG TPA: permease [Deltaproteobacteria bacterium]|nr:permease [Deltaproteobacteria bacterium]
MKEWQKLLIIIAVFLGVYYIPWDSVIIRQSMLEAFMMLQEYAREHVLTCLIPAFFIAGAIAVFVSQAALLKYFGAKANKILSYSVASVSGSVLAVCSCTVLPLFAGIYTRGAGIGPATAFLYSGPAINVLAIILTAKVLGWKLGLARAIGAIFFAVIAGLLMAYIFRKDDANRQTGELFLPEDEKTRPLWQNGVYMLTMALILIFASFARPTEGDYSLWQTIFSVKWYLAAGLLFVLAVMLKKWFVKEEIKDWVKSTWDFALQILPLLLVGVLVAGFLLGRPGHPALIPEQYIQALVGGNSLGANFFASIVGALMYFATLTEIPILQGLIGSGMGQGPALALLLAGPALSVPNMIIIASVLGAKKTFVYCVIVVILSTIAGMCYGWLAG